jgi:hypothetical protein
VLRAQVPTFRSDPLTPACDTWCEFPVSDRPNAVAQFLAAAQRNASLIQARLIRVRTRASSQAVRSLVPAFTLSAAAAPRDEHSQAELKHASARRGAPAPR